MPRDAHTTNDWREALVARQQAVLEHYRRVLTRGPVPAGELAAILDRVARVEDEIRALTGRTFSDATKESLAA